MRIGNEYTVDITEHTQFILRTRISSVRNELYRATYAGTGREAHNNLCEKYLDAIVEYADYVISDQSSEVSVAEEILTFLDTVKVGLGDIRARNLVSSERCYDMFTQALFFLGYRWPPEEFRTEWDKCDNYIKTLPEHFEDYCELRKQSLFFHLYNASVQDLSSITITPN